MKSIVGFITRMLVSIIGKKRIIHYSFNEDELKAYNMLHYGYLDEIGWWNSFRAHKPVDKKGQPIPWTTYSFIDFIQGRLHKNITLLEYGSGNSTAYFAARVGHVYSIEHDKAWFETVTKSKPDNATIIAVNNNAADYTQGIAALDRKFDIIFVDGIFRNECIRYALPYLTPSGVIILDDSNFNHDNKDDFEVSFQLLRENGFKRIDFWGISPSLFYRKSTSIFYKPGNCLDI